MNREQIFEKLNIIFRDVFFDESIVLSETTSSRDIEGWDSLENINIIAAIESEFSITIDVKASSKLKNVGEMVNLILRSKK